MVLDLQDDNMSSEFFTFSPITKVTPADQELAAAINRLHESLTPSRWPDRQTAQQRTVAARDAALDSVAQWNPYNKVVQDLRDGHIDLERTNEERARRGLPVPWE